MSAGSRFKPTLLLLIVALASPKIYGQSLPRLSSVKVKANLTVSRNLFSYGYAVKNDSANSGAIWVFDIDISQPMHGTTLSSDGLLNGQGLLGSAAEAVLSQSVTVPMVPVGLGAPNGWFVSPSVSGAVAWGPGNSRSLILPGQELDGFQITSHGLPGIRAFTARPHLEEDELPAPPVDPSDLDRYLKDLSTIEDAVSFKGLTVGPTAPPADFKPIDFLHTIQSYKEQALKQGWIDNSGIANSLDAKINAAQQALQAGDNSTARNILSALVNEVDAQSGEHLTSEAVALLKFNALFLISKIS